MKHFKQFEQHSLTDARKHITHVLQPTSECREAYNKFKSIYKKLGADDSVLDLFNYLVLPMILDDFGNDHAARREWRDKLAEHNEKLQKFVDTGKLRVNQIGSALNGINMQQVFMPNLKEPINNIEYVSGKMIKYAQNIYGKSSLKNKIKFSKMVDKMLIKFINQVYEEYK